MSLLLQEINWLKIKLIFQFREKFLKMKINKTGCIIERHLGGPISKSSISKQKFESYMTQKVTREPKGMIKTAE